MLSKGQHLEDSGGDFPLLREMDESCAGTDMGPCLHVSGKSPSDNPSEVI
jgi:hypothetical protein